MSREYKGDTWESESIHMDKKDRTEFVTEHAHIDRNTFNTLTRFCGTEGDRR